LASVEIEKMVKGQENVIDDSSISRNDKHNILITRLEPRSDKESPEVEFTDVVIHVNVNEEEEEITNKVGILHVPHTTCRTFAVHPRDQDDPHDDAHPEGKNSAKQQKTSEYEAYVSGESSSGQDNEKEQGPST
nr:hypothetical protein [Tanacetum cinerariifolium]